MGLFAFLPVSSSPFVEDGFYFPLYMSGLFFTNQVFIGVFINAWSFDFFPFVHMSVFMTISCGFYYDRTTVKFDDIS